MSEQCEIFRNMIKVKLYFFDNGDIGIIPPGHQLSTNYLWTGWKKLLARPPWRWFASDENELYRLIDLELKKSPKQPCYNKLLEKFKE